MDHTYTSGIVGYSQLGIAPAGFARLQPRHSKGIKEGNVHSFEACRALIDKISSCKSVWCMPLHLLGRGGSSGYMGDPHPALLQQHKAWATHAIQSQATEPNCEPSIPQGID